MAVAPGVQRDRRPRAAAFAIIAIFVASCGNVAIQSSPSPLATLRPHVLERSDLVTVVTAAAGLTYRASYSVNGKLQERANGIVRDRAVSGRWITYQKPNTRRLDVFVFGLAFSPDSSQTIYLTTSAVYVCALPYKPPCKQYDASTPVLDPERGMRANLDLFRTATVLDDRIAGQDVTCFRARPDDAGKLMLGAREFNMCYTADGIALRMEIRGENLDLQFEGVQLIRDVAEAEVRLPADALTNP